MFPDWGQPTFVCFTTQCPYLRFWCFEVRTHFLRPYCTLTSLQVLMPSFLCDMFTYFWCLGFGFFFSAVSISKLRQQHLSVQRRGRWLGVSCDLRRTFIHRLESVFWRFRTQTGILQWRPHCQDLAGVSTRPGWNWWGAKILPR